MWKFSGAIALAACLGLAGMAHATVYLDPGGTNDLTGALNSDTPIDPNVNGDAAYEPRMDIVSMSVTNTTSTITFAVTVNAPVVQDSPYGRFFVFGMYTPNASGPANKNATNISVSRNIYAVNGDDDLGVNRRIFARAGVGGDFARYTGNGSTTTFANVGSSTAFDISGNTFSYTVPLSYFGDFDSGGNPIPGTVNVGDVIYISLASTTDVAGTNAMDSLGDAQLLPSATSDSYTAATTIHSVAYTITAVPEPASVGLAALAGVGLLARRKRMN